MSKKLLSTLTAIISLFIFTTSLSAQDVQLATLQSGDNLQVFYGDDALKNALNVCEDGDLITLSAGKFNAGVNITKAITLQGAGYITDAAQNKYATIVGGDLTAALPEGTSGLIIEGIELHRFLSSIDLSGAIIRRCKIDGLYFSLSNTKSINCLVENCRVKTLQPDSNSENLHVKSSIIHQLGENSNTATLFVENCIITNYVRTSTTAYFQNNIIGGVYTTLSTTPYYSYTRSLASSCRAYNNVFIRGNANDVSIQANNHTTTSEVLFGINIHSLSGSYGYDTNEVYELTEEAKLTYLGTDGTQVGIYGGDKPFTSIPTNPQIVEQTIDKKSTADGKLNVSIKVEAQ